MTTNFQKVIHPEAKKNTCIFQAIANALPLTYVESCKQFARDTQDWAALDQYKYYTTPGDREGWEETPGNEHGGIPVDWAFHKSAAEIETEAPQQFVDMLIAAVEWDLDLDYDVISKSIKVFRRL